jgi:hypothetical protein
MRRPGTRAALDLYDELAAVDSVGGVRHGPASLVLVHALLRPLSGQALSEWDQRSSAHPVFLDFSDQQRAACGIRMKVVFPHCFDDNEDEACGTCRIEVRRWALNPEAWWREQSRWEQRKRAQASDENVAVWRALQDRWRSWAERHGQSGEPDG